MDEIYFALPSILCFLLTGLPLEKSPQNSRVSVIVHRRIGSAACELVQRGSLMAQKQEFAWLEIDGTNGEIYSPEVGPYDYLTPTLPLPGAIAKTARKSGFELKASATTSSDMPEVAALSGGANCPDLLSAIDEVEKERTSRREQLQSKIYGLRSEGITPVHVNNTPLKSEQVSVDPPKNDAGTQPKNKKLQGTVILAVVIGGLREIGEPSRKAMIVNLAQHNLRARTVGPYYLVRSLSITPASAIGGLLWRIRPQTPSIVAGIIGIGGTLLFAATVEEERAG